MFDIGWGDFMVLVLAGLFILGPERLPGAAALLGRTVRQVRAYASSAQEQLRAEMGPEFDELRKPLADLRDLRNRDPKRIIAQHLLDATGGYDPREDIHIDLPTVSSGNVAPSNGASPAPAPTTWRPPADGESAPVDLDTT